MDKGNKTLVMAMRQGKYIDVQSKTLDEAFKEYIIFNGTIHVMMKLGKTTDNVNKDAADEVSSITG